MGTTAVSYAYCKSKYAVSTNMKGRTRFTVHVRKWRSSSVILGSFGGKNEEGKSLSDSTIV